MDNNQTDGVTDDPKTGKTTNRRWLRFALRAVLVLLLLVAAGSAIIIYLARSEPTYWKEHQVFLRESTPEQLEQLAEQVDLQLQSLANLGLDPIDREADAAMQSLNALAGSDRPDDNQAKVKPEDVHINIDQVFTLTNDQLAAVVQTRLEDWMSDRGYDKPTEITDPLVAVDDGSLVMAFQLQLGSFAQIVSGRFDLQIHNDGMAELSMKRFLVGTLPVPANAVGKHLRQMSGGNSRATEVGEWLEKLQHLEFKPVIELDHRRRARVQDYKLLDHGLELTVRVQDHKTYKLMNQALAGVAAN